MRMKRTMETQQQDVEKQIGGCMAGFFNIFDRPHVVSPKRLSSSSAVSLKSSAESESESERSSPSPLKQPTTPSIYSTPELRSPAPVMESRSPWRFSKEAPRLSLDSRAVVDAKGSLKPRQIQPSNGSPSVIARLMGLEALPQQQPLQRSASESRVSRFADSFNFQQLRDEDPAPPPPQRCIVRPKSFFDATDFFPEPREKATKTNDLETLQQLVEAHRLRGLLHSSIRPHSNLVFETPIKPRSRSLVSPPKRDQNNRGRSRTQNSLKSPNRRPTLKCKDDDYNRRQGKVLLERCDKLLHSIAEMAAAASEAGGDSQPSPVSVLDASLYHDDSSPSPVMKRTLDFPESEDEHESWGGCSDSEYLYISDILRASHCLPQDSDVFSFLEKQQYLKGQCASTAAAQARRLIFDAVQEIVARLPPWSIVGEGAQMLQFIWSEFHKLKQNKCGRNEEDLMGYVSGLLGKDLSEDRWRDCPVEMSQAVLDIERLIFKDVIGETIRNLYKSVSLPRRLVFS